MMAEKSILFREPVTVNGGRRGCSFHIPIKNRRHKPATPRCVNRGNGSVAQDSWGIPLNAERPLTSRLDVNVNAGSNPAASNKYKKTISRGGQNMTEQERCALLHQAAQNIRQKIITTIGLASGIKLHDELTDIIMKTQIPDTNTEIEQEQLWD